MLEETYFKFKKNILPKMKKMQPNFQESVVEYCEPEQVIDICSYNHYPILDKSCQQEEKCNDDIKPDTPINVYTWFCLNTAKSKFSLVSPVADW